MMIRSGFRLFSFLCIALWLAPVSARAAALTLDDGTTVQGEVLQMDDEHVLVGMPRAAIRAVDGKPLAKPLVAGVPAPAFTATDLAGAAHTIGQGHAKITVLHFWVQWCPHCRTDAPKVQALHDRYRDNPAVRVVTINMDDKRADLDRFIAEHHATYPVIFSAAHAVGPDGRTLPDLYQVTGFPVTLLIDQQGIIRHKFNGSFTESGKDLEALVAGMLGTS